MEPNNPTTKPLIIHLIQQDMLHNQLVLGLEDLGLCATHNYSLDIYRAVTQLMGIPEQHRTKLLYQLYESYLEQKSTHLQPIGQIAPLFNLAEQCFTEMQLCRRVEGRVAT